LVVDVDEVVVVEIVNVENVAIVVTEVAGAVDVVVVVAREMMRRSGSLSRNSAVW
jgi:hypothetical protein